MQGDLLAGLEVVVLAQGPAAGAAGAELQDSLRQHWRNIASLCKNP